MILILSKRVFVITMILILSKRVFITIIPQKCSASRIPWTASRYNALINCLWRTSTNYIIPRSGRHVTCGITRKTAQNCSLSSLFGSIINCITIADSCLLYLHSNHNSFYLLLQRFAFKLYMYVYLYYHSQSGYCRSATLCFSRT